MVRRHTDADGRVTELGLSRNELSGEIPAELRGLASLESLDLEGDRLSECVPGSLRDQLNTNLSVSESDLGGLTFC